MKLSIERIKEMRAEAESHDYTGIVLALDELITIREAQGVPYMWELWKRDETTSDYWFLCERSTTKLIALKNQKVIELFTAPQLPVVLSFDAWCESKGDKPLGWVREAMKEAYEAAIEAAGGIVKEIE